MIISEDEKFYPAREAIERVINKRVHASTIHRWRLKGVQGVRLETVKVGGQRMCTLAAVRKFIAATNARDVDRQLSLLPQRSVDGQLDAMGI